MGALRHGRAIYILACVLLALALQPALADSPSAVVDPDGFRESVTADKLREMGLNPEEYKVEVPLGRLQFQRSYVRAGGEGLFSEGLTERGTDVIHLSLNPRATLDFTQDEARYELHGVRLTGSTKRTAAFTQAFGTGPTAGTLSLTHTDAHASDIGLGFTRSRSDKAALTMGLGKSFGLTASAEDAANVAQIDARTRKYDFALAKPGVAIPLAEYHQTISSVGMATTDLTQITLRTPTIEVGGVATVGASRALTDSSVTGQDTVDTLNLTAAPTERVSLTASHVASDRETAPDTAVTTIGSQIKLRPDATVTAGLTDTETEGVGTTTSRSLAVALAPTGKVSLSAGHVASGAATGPDTAVTTLGSQIQVRPGTTVTAGLTGTETEGVGTTTSRSVALAMAPTDGKGLGLEASYTDIGVTNAPIEPTIHVRLTYATPGRWEFTGLYHDESGRPDPELAAALKTQFLGGALGLNYSECTYDASTKAVRLTRSFGTELSRPLLWGFSGRVGYQRTDNLADPTVAERVRVGLGGPTTPLGAVDVQYETGQLRTAAGRLPDGSTVALSVSRRIGNAELALTGKHALPSSTLGPLPASDAVHLDLKAAW